MILMAGMGLLLVVGVGLAVTAALSQVAPAVRAVRSRAAIVAGRVAVAGFALALLPGTVADLRDVIDRDDATESPASETRG